jgi:ATP-dependent DNA helicase RecG
MSFKLKDSINTIPGVGPKNKTFLEKMGIQTLQDLLYYLPTRHEDTRDVLDIAALLQAEEGTVKAYVRKIDNVRTRRMTLTKATIEDHSGSLNVIWFNQPFLKNTIKQDSEVLLSGKVDSKSPSPQLKNPKYEVVKESGEESLHLGRITPVYQVTEGLSLKWFRARLKAIVDIVESLVKESYAKDFLEKFKLVKLHDALKQIHFPENEDEFLAARRRLAFDELLEIQRIMEEKRKKWRERKAAIIQPGSDAELNKLFDFELTRSQKNSIKEALDDMQRGFPMRRLLAGDVGSGKTAVAIAASVSTVKANKRVLYMAPTTILAEQHYHTFTKYLPPEIKVSLITSQLTKKEREEALKADIIIGTQALLFADEESLINSGLVIVDEQHRFGVVQREKLAFSNQEKEQPHLLSLTATPIPRTLSLTLFGDIDVSYLDEVPKGRIPVKTHLVPEKKRESSYDWIKKEIKANAAQVFFICPLVSESEKTQAKSALQTFEDLSQSIFKDFKVALVHGQLKETDKLKVIQDFKDKKYDILVATPVIEVGIDIPGATIIAIENAERFGLAQLHQLRGRVGRSDKQSYCLAFYDELSEVSKRRLKAFSKENSGLKLAEFDLTLRGPGEVYGIKQSGLPDLHVASLTDVDMLKETKEALDFLNQS